MNTETMKALREEGYTYQKIADLAGISKQAVHNRLHPENRYTEKYRTYKREYYHKKKREASKRVKYENPGYAPSITKKK